MKIAILTQPLGNNYGGLLQAYALQKYLANYNHDVFVVDIKSDKKARFFGLRTIVKNVIEKYIFKKNILDIFPLNSKRIREISQNSNRFIVENIKTTQTIFSIDEIVYLKKYNFDAYIVGSDQVWRPEYSYNLPAFFLDFVKDVKGIKRIAYAASFGVDHCNEFKKEQLIEFSELLKKFNIIGVREDSGVDLCRQFFGINSEHVIDPTLLLDRDDYCKLVYKDNVPKHNGDLMIYVLDKNPNKNKIIDKIVSYKKLSPYEITVDKKTGVYPSVTKWIRGFIDAKYVITDSFHGVAFSIIFNKPFIAIGNKERGLTRFTSILKLFDLNERMVFSETELSSELIDKKIDFEKINKIREKESKKSFRLLIDTLK